MPARNSLPRSFSLKKRTEITNLLKTGRRLSGEFCTLITEPAESFTHAILVGRKHGNAADRNRIKRRMREAIRLTGLQHSLLQRMIFIPRPLAMEPEFETLRHDVATLLSKA